ncbi:transposase family protein [Streptomonospora alba]|uniref:transposase family protein n=1 Tax=Streptomonospora alba TaxID=183763 RepID=UPI002377DCD8|nr:transposase family protein [Streptomonospora alba]
MPGQSPVRNWRSWTAKNATPSTCGRAGPLNAGAGTDRAFYSGKHKCHGVSVQVVADSFGRLVWISPALPGARHDMGAGREHGIIDAFTTAGVRAITDTAYQGGGPAIRVLQRRRRIDPDTGRYRRLSRARKEVNTAHARQRGPGQRRAEEPARPAQDPFLPRPGLRTRRRSSDPHARHPVNRLAKAQ